MNRICTGILKLGVCCSVLLPLWSSQRFLQAQESNPASGDGKLEQRVADLEKRNAELERMVQELLNGKAPATETPAKSADAFQLPKSAKMKVSGEIRVRPEFNDNFDFDSGQHGPAAVDAVFQDNNDFVGMRSRLNFDFDVCEQVRAFVQLQDSRYFGEEANTLMNDKNTDFHQLYFDLRNLGEYWPTVRVGRQELKYGDERLVGPVGWHNIGRSFDGFRAWWERERWTFDVFGANVSEPDDLDRGQGANQSTGNGTADDDTLFSGAYGMYRIAGEKGEKLSAEAYVFHFRNGDGRTLGSDGRTGDLAFFTLGSRWFGKMHGFDYAAEAAWQTGDFAHQDLRAWAAHARLGYTFDVAWKPRLGAEYNHATGDDNPLDDDKETFFNLFPTNHNKYGFMDQACWQNLRNWRVSASCTPRKNWDVSVDYHWFWLEEEEDSFYTLTGAARAAGTGFNGGRAALTSANILTANRDDEIGQEVDIVVKYKYSDHVQFEAGYAHFFAGDFLDDTSNPDPVTSLPKNADDADWAYFQITVGF